ncbi:hypothetical protein K504DRAFT_466742 [Pleomassaria siparia CBS 279.74]|uniref:Uncharacterized protein n=1 Tax=Pleomassaria siparia CBS 279.74 TaxID=1314801 RepID=A0A6G1KBY9_9PLEO|nr:hypothetical protein K504DRAFT_466742 [Pleomassaria siparia CBS 279.74]
MGNTQSHPDGLHNKLSKPQTNTNSPDSASSRYADLSVRDRRMLKARLTAMTPMGEGTSCFDHEDGLGELASRMRQSNLSTSRPTRIRDSTTNGSKVDLGEKSSREDLAAPTTPSPTVTPAPDLKRRISLLNRPSLSLIRRRSLAATLTNTTRDSPTEPTRRWSSWRRHQLEPEEEARWNRDIMDHSPFARIAALDLAEGRESPRAQTPCDLDYSHLGSLKLGSLIVTNGAASPAPSTVVQRKSITRLYEEADDLAVPEASSSLLTRKKSKKWGHTRSKSGAPPKVSALQRNLSISDEIRRAKTLSRCDSPLKTETFTPYVDDAEAETFKMRLRVINMSADTLARAYMADIPNSPFEAANLDVDQTLHPDGSCFRQEAFRILDEPASPQSPTTTSSMSTDGRPSPRKADSGYSSGGSARTSGHQVPRELHTFHLAISLEKPLPPLPTPLDEAMVRRPTKLQIPVSVTEVANASPVSVASKFTMDSQASSASKRLQRRRPCQPELPVVQSCQPIPDGTIPSIPTNVRAQFVRRLSESPDMECLTTTYLSKEHVDSSESIDAPIVMPEARRRNGERHSTRRPKSLMRSISLFRSKSSLSRDQKQGGIHLGTTAQMLGQSPHAALPVPPPHAHQLEARMHRARSMVHMDSLTAAEFARMRSRDIAERPDFTRMQNIAERPKTNHGSDVKARTCTRHNVYTYPSADEPQPDWDSHVRGHVFLQRL